MTLNTSPCFMAIRLAHRSGQDGGQTGREGQVLCREFGYNHLTDPANSRPAFVDYTNSVSTLDKLSQARQFLPHSPGVI